MAIALAGQAASLEELELTSYEVHTTIRSGERPLDVSQCVALRSLRLDRFVVLEEQLPRRTSVTNDIVRNEVGEMQKQRVIRFLGD